MDERKKKEGNEARDLVGFLVTSTFPTVLLKRIRTARHIPFHSWGLVLEVLENKDPDRLYHVQENPE
jgi:hypothetical protein